MKGDRGFGCLLLLLFVLVFVIPWGLLWNIATILWSTL